MTMHNLFSHRLQLSNQRWAEHTVNQLSLSVQKHLLEYALLLQLLLSLGLIFAGEYTLTPVMVGQVARTGVCRCGLTTCSISSNKPVGCYHLIIKAPWDGTSILCGCYEALENIISIDHQPCCCVEGAADCC